MLTPNQVFVAVVIGVSRSSKLVKCVLVCYIAICRVVMKFRVSGTWYTQEMKWLL
jgi:hypothetical protein